MVHVACIIKEPEGPDFSTSSGDATGAKSVSKSGISIPRLDRAGFDEEDSGISTIEVLLESLSIVVASTTGDDSILSSSEKRSSNTGDSRLFESLDTEDE